MTTLRFHQILQPHGAANSKEDFVDGDELDGREPLESEESMPSLIASSPTRDYRDVHIETHKRVRRRTTWSIMGSEGQALTRRLRMHVEQLAGEIGERNVLSPTALQAVASQIEREWEQQGYAVTQIAYDVSGVRAHVALYGRRAPKMSASALSARLLSHQQAGQGAAGANPQDADHTCWPRGGRMSLSAFRQFLNGADWPEHCFGTDILCGSAARLPASTTRELRHAEGRFPVQRRGRILRGGPPCWLEGSLCC